MQMSSRAYSLLEIKSLDDERRTIQGIATTPEADLLEDVVEPKGAAFNLPIPFLWQHNADKPIGHVTKAKVTTKGIEVEIQLKKTDEAGPVKDRLDSAWQDIKLGLVRGLSIGFKGIETAKIEGGFGIRFLKWIWLELSAVTIAANQSASIITIKQIDAELLAASGHEQQGSDTEPPAPRQRSTKVVKAKEARPMTTKTRAEQISAFEATRQSKAARMDAIMDESSEKSETLDAAGKEEYDTLESEVKEIDEHLKRMRSAESRAIATATEVNGKSADDASTSRGNGIPAFSVQVRPNVEKGITFARAVWCKGHAYMNHTNPAEVARSQPWHNQTPEVELYLKTAVTPGTTTTPAWAGYLVEVDTLASEFAELLRPATIIGRIPGITRVPFNVKVNREITAASVGWVGELGVKPVGPMAFDQIELLFNKVAGIVPVSEELFRFSNPSIDSIIRKSLIDSVSYLIDRDFLDPTKAAVTGVSPASVTNGVTPITATGTNADALRADLGTLLGEYIELNLSIASLVLVMTATQAVKISLMRNTLGQREFEGLTRDGGTLEGIPVIISENIVATGGSPANGGLIVAINASDILLADDGGVNIDMSREASLQMDTAPNSPATASTVMVSLWQRNMVALKAERFITWKKRRDGAVQFLQNAKYA